MKSSRTLPVFVILFLVAVTAAIGWSEGPSWAYHDLRKALKDNRADEAAQYVDAMLLQDCMWRLGYRTFLVLRDPLNIPGVRLGTPLVCEVVLPIVDGNPTGYFPLREAPRVDVARDGPFAVWLTPRSRNQGDPLLSLRMELKRARWKLVSFKPLRPFPHWGPCMSADSLQIHGRTADSGAVTGVTSK